MISAKIEPLKLHCNKCLNFTNHAILWTQQLPWDEDMGQGNHIYGEDAYKLVRCAGCDTIRLQHAHWFSEDVDGEGRVITHIDFYPPTITRRPPSWRTSYLLFNAKVYEELLPLLDEIYSAHASGGFRLAAMGLRALVEVVMVDMVGNHGTFAGTIDKFFEEGFVAKRQQEHFKGVLVEAGHAAIHRQFSPQREDIDFLLDVTEGLIDNIYFQPNRAGMVEKKIPPRK